MSSPTAKLLVLAGQEFIAIRIVGRANLNSSVDFRTLVNELRQKGYRYFILDLSECVLMDSSFLGVLAGFGLKMTGDSPEKCAGMIELSNPNTRILELIENLGVLHLFKVTKGPLEVPEGTQSTVVDACEPNRIELASACKEAHDLLMDLNPENVARFKDVSQFMAEELKKLKGPADRQ
jgi:anti-sigma B factor antagonist